MHASCIFAWITFEMSHYICHITFMARGESGRIVIEVEPETKKRLYAALALSGSTLKDWFLKEAATYCKESAEPSLLDQHPSRPSAGLATNGHSQIDDPAKK